MSIQEFMSTMVKYLSEWISKKFTGKIVFTLNMRDGGIASVHVTVDHQLKKD